MISKVTIIGPGALGKALGLVFFDDLNPDFIGRRKDEFAHKSQKYPIIHLQSEEAKLKIQEADFIVLSVPDATIPEMVSFLEPFVNASQTVVHVSGAVSSQVLEPLKRVGIKTGVLHFLQTFQPQAFQNEQVFDGISASFVGDEAVLEQLSLYIKSKNITLIHLDDEQKKNIHIAGVFLSNFQHVLFDAALKSNLIEEHKFTNLMMPLVQQTLENIRTGGVITTLSGPVKRHDEKTIQAHLKALESLPKQQKLYAELTHYLKKALAEKEKE